MDFSVQISDLGLAAAELHEYKVGLVGAAGVGVISEDRRIQAPEPERSHIMTHHGRDTHWHSKI